MSTTTSRSPEQPVRAVVLQHVAHEGPGLIAPALTASGAQVEERRLYDGDAVPGVADLDVLVVMGGYMGAFDDDEHPYLADERRLLADCVRAEVPVLGVCLGAQLLAAALGSPVRRGPEPEDGPGSVALTSSGRLDPLFTDLGDELPVLHWHQDTFDVPDGATLLAGSALYPHQAFRIGPSYGLQFHVEMDDDAIAAVTPYLPDGVTVSPEQAHAIQHSGRQVVRRWAAGAVSQATRRG